MEHDKHDLARSSLATRQMSAIPPHYVKDSEGNWCHPSRIVGAVLPTKPKQNSLPALDSGKTARPKRKGSVAVRVTLIRCGHRSLDSDNLQGSLKSIRDSVSRSIGIDDNDIRVQWEYGQCETRGRTGVIVKIESV